MMSFDKSELQTGMVVELRSGRRYLVINGTSKGEDWLTSPYSGISLDHYSDDLKYNTTDEFDIVKIYKPPYGTITTMLQSTSSLIWERNEIEWSKVPVDTPILVSADNKKYIKRYFQKYENGKVYAFAGGSTSWSADEYSTSPWKYAQLLTAGAYYNYKKDQSNPTELKVLKSIHDDCSTFNECTDKCKYYYQGQCRIIGAPSQWNLHGLEDE